MSDPYNKKSPELAPEYLRLLLEIFAYAGEQIPRTPSVPQQALKHLPQRGYAPIKGIINGKE
jgi:hypothetical protein